jgi:hypothetical protein
MMLEGGCLCGAVRYRIDASDGIVDYCHCRTCQRAAGAPVVAWVQVAPERFALTAGTLASFASSPGCDRHFCARCGTQISMTDHGGRSVGVTVASLDQPDRLAPSSHGWTSAQLEWLAIKDDLPRYPQTPPHDEP